MKPFALVAMAALALSSAGCVSKLAESRVRSALVDAGVSPANAACMAERMTDRLSLAQLRRLEALRAPKRSLADYVWTVRRLDDPQLVDVTVSAAALCAMGLAPEKR
jgi:pyrroline-5-carboxylate reductase